MKEVAGRLFFTVLAAGLTILVGYLIKRKIVDESFSFPWIPIVVLGFVSFILLALAIISWWGSNFEKKSIQREAELVSVTNERIVENEAGDSIYYWTFTCQWQDGISRQTITASSPIFTGKKVYYNRSKILVHTDPDQQDVIHFVDISFLSDTNQSGIPIVTPKEIEAAWLKQKAILQQRQNTWWGKILAPPLRYFSENTVMITILSTALTIILAIGIVIRIWWKIKQQ